MLSHGLCCIFVFSLHHVYVYIHVAVHGSVAKLCPTLCHPMDCSTPGFPVIHYLLELAQTHVH